MCVFVGMHQKRKTNAVVIGSDCVVSYAREHVRHDSDTFNVCSEYAGYCVAVLMPIYGNDMRLQTSSKHRKCESYHGRENGNVSDRMT